MFARHGVDGGAVTSRFTRRRLVELGGALAAATLTKNAFGSGLSGAPPTQGSEPTSSTFVTEPSWNPPAITVDTPAEGPARPRLRRTDRPRRDVHASDERPRPLFGPMILDNSGQPVWFLPLATEVAQNFRAQTYRGKPVLTWYEGPTGSTYGGSCVIYDSGYRELKRVHGGNGYSCGDLFFRRFPARDQRDTTTRSRRIHNRTRPRRRRATTNTRRLKLIHIDLAIHIPRHQTTNRIEEQPARIDRTRGSYTARRLQYGDQAGIVAASEGSPSPTHETA